MVVCVPTVLEGRVTFLSFGNVEKIVSLTSISGGIQASAGRWLRLFSSFSFTNPV